MTQRSASDSCVLIFSLIGLLFVSSTLLVAAVAVPLVAVHDRGSMEDILKDKGASKLNLSELQTGTHVYGLGPLSKMRGEVMIWDSQPFESRVGVDGVHVKSDWNEDAAFFVWCSVKKWQKVQVPTAVRSMAMFEQWLFSMSGKPGAPLRFQYPFLIKGHFGKISWHIMNVHDDGKPLTAEKLQVQRYHGESKDLHAEVLGFYSPAHAGIFIPQGRRTHMHFKVGDSMVAHIDDFDPFGENGLTLFVPIVAGEK